MHWQSALEQVLEIVYTPLDHDRVRWAVIGSVASVLHGCMGTNGGRLSGYGSMCEIRACGVERGVTNCAHCAEYACEKLEGFFGFAPEARAVLDQIRASQ